MVFLEIIPSQMRVYLRRSDIRMSQEFLDGAHIEFIDVAYPLISNEIP